MELSLGLFFGNQGQIRQPLSEEISLLKCSSRSKQKILGLRTYPESFKVIAQKL